MLSWLKRKAETTAEEPSKPTTWVQRLHRGLKRTREQLGSGLVDLVRGKKTIDAELLEELETRLLLADVGIEATSFIINDLTEKTHRKQLKDPEQLLEGLRQHLIDLLTPYAQPLTLEEKSAPFVILMVGVNGAGKTTTIGKLTHWLQEQNKRPLLAAGDTFRAAAVEQLTAWADRLEAPIIAQHTGADSASVIFDALKAAQARQYDVLIADTAGRLHTQGHLMEELKKVKRVMQKIDDAAPHECLLVLDASSGQNGLKQAREFHQALGVTGIVVTKLDGTAKGGIVFAIAKELGLPLRFIGVGEGENDLRPFNATDFVEALF